MIPPMTFDYLSWEAFATLITGALAVGAAIYVGRKQTDIQTKQVLIQNRLADLEEFKLKQALFDARYAVYRSAQTWLTSTLLSKLPPFEAKTLEGAKREVEMGWATNFYDAIDRSRFLFRSAVHDELFKMWKSGDQLRRSHEKLQDHSTTVAQRIAEEELRDKALAYLKGLNSNFSELFGDELVLTAHGRTPPTVAP